MYKGELAALRKHKVDNNNFIFLLQEIAKEALEKGNYKEALRRIVEGDYVSLDAFTFALKKHWRPLDQPNPCYKSLTKKFKKDKRFKVVD